MSTNDDAILGYVYQYTQVHGIPPLYREIADYTGLTLSTVKYRVKLLTLADHCWLDPTTAHRKLQLTETGMLIGKRVASTMSFPFEPREVDATSPLDQLTRRVEALEKRLDQLLIAESKANGWQVWQKKYSSVKAET